VTVTVTDVAADMATAAEAWQQLQFHGKVTQSVSHMCVAKTRIRMAAAVGDCAQALHALHVTTITMAA
jgi:hypothetical protein